MTTRSLVIATAALLPLGAAAPVGAAAKGHHALVTGFDDETAYRNDDPAQRQAAFTHTRAARASRVRFFVNWASVAPHRPPSAGAARSPSWSGYQWQRTDRVVREVHDAGLTAFPTFAGAPAWAEGANRPRVSTLFPAGSWRPSARAFGEFATAMARRYSGSYPDPLRPGHELPRIRYWQGWNEPNLNGAITPQYSRSGHHYVATAPFIYKALLNAFYSGVKSVHSSNFVVSGGLAPYGDYNRDPIRTPPARFARYMLCVRGRTHPKPARHCRGGPAKFDALAAHPYPFDYPLRPAINPDDIVMPDFWKLSRPLRVAERAGYVRPRKHKQLWATEFSYDSSPPDPGGLPTQTQARWLEGSLYELWHQGVSDATWWQLRDSAKGIGYRYTLQSGIFYRGATVGQDKPKPSYTAFRFPFTAYSSHGVAQLWGLAPAGGRVSIQRLGCHGWSTIRRLTAGHNRVFFGRARLAGGTAVRARYGKQASLGWNVGTDGIKFHRKMHPVGRCKGR